VNDLAKIDLSEAEFAGIRELVLENTGISLADSKKELVKRRFTRRVKELGLSSFSSYINHVKNNHEKEISDFCNAITTNLTSFFRENHHYEFLKKEAIPKIEQRNGPKGRKLRIWSSGCSSGQEAYCLAITLREAISSIDRWDVKILATDLDEKCLGIARAGIYATDSLEKVSKNLVSRYFTETEEVGKYRNTKKYKATSDLQEMITFNKLNLMHTHWPMKGEFDVIYCRNVFIYFDKKTQHDLLVRYASHQGPGGYLCLGHSETIIDPQAIGYRLIGKTTYIRE
jgi:chemotaxis protein methyltransferase CheR